MRKIKYVGKKEFKADLMYGTNLTWMRGETHLVEDAKAQKLCFHTDVWADVTGEAATPDEAPDDMAEMVEAVEPEQQEEEQDFPMVDLEGMTKAELSQFAMREFNIEFGSRDSKDKMVETLRIQVGRNNVR